MEGIQWAKLTPDERDMLIHTKIMGKQPEPCRDGQLDPYMGSYWGCTCGWVSPFHLGTHESTEHNKPVPCYTESMDAAWLLIKKLATLSNTELNEWWQKYEFLETLGAKNFFEGYKDELFVTVAVLASWTPARLCLAALRATGYSVEDA